jgi:hypothetical protein
MEIQLRLFFIRLVFQTKNCKDLSDILYFAVFINFIVSSLKLISASLIL